MVEQLDLFETAVTEDNYDDSLGLTPRQWELYRYIKRQSFMGRKVTQKDICCVVDGYVYNPDENCHDHCPAIWHDVNEINNSNLDKLIISDKFVYWIGTKEETEQYIDKLWKDLEPRLCRYWFFKKKIARDGQGQLLARSGRPIDENSKARDYIEAFINEE